MLTNAQWLLTTCQPLRQPNSQRKSTAPKQTHPTSCPLALKFTMAQGPCWNSKVIGDEWLQWWWLQKCSQVSKGTVVHTGRSHHTYSNRWKIGLLASRSKPQRGHAILAHSQDDWTLVLLMCEVCLFVCVELWIYNLINIHKATHRCSVLGLVCFFGAVLPMFLNTWT